MFLIYAIRIGVDGLPWWLPNQVGLLATNYYVCKSMCVCVCNAGFVCMVRTYSKFVQGLIGVPCFHILIYILFSVA